MHVARWRSLFNEVYCTNANVVLRSNPGDENDLAELHQPEQEGAGAAAEEGSKAETETA